jgi:DNA-binding transcriptional MocR family regulator
MSTYVIISLGESSPAVDSKVEQKIPSEDRLKLDGGRWLVNSSLPTSKELSDSLDISAAEPLATYLICPIRGYYGRARPDVWEWLAAKSITTSAKS